MLDNDVLHRYAGQPAEVTKLKAMSRAWHTIDGFWKFDAVLSALERRTTRLYYLPGPAVSQPIPAETDAYQGDVIPAGGWSAAIIYSVAMENADMIYVFVAPEYRRQGYGLRILKESIQELIALGVHQLTLEVRTSNIAAQGLYGTLGFKVIDRRLRYYADSEDALVMQKILKPGTDSGSAQ